MAVYNNSSVLDWFRRIFTRQCDAGVRPFDAMTKRNLEAALRDAGFSWSDAKVAVSVFAHWSKTGALRDVEATPDAQRIEKMPATVKSTQHRTGGTSIKELK